MGVQIAVENFGPIASGTISLRPLTVLIGPNNTGKSYLAMLTYAANHRAPSGGFHYRYVGQRAWGRIVAARRETGITSGAKKFLTKWQESEDPERPTAPDSVIADMDRIVRSLFKLYGAELIEEIERCFGRDLTNLIRIDGTSRRRNCVEITHDDPRWTLRVNVRDPSSAELLVPPKVGRAFHESLTWLDRQFRRRRIRPLEPLWEELVDATFRRCFSSFPNLAYYLPAARSGILQSHQLLASIIVSRSSFAGIEEMQVGKLTGVLSDFISHLLQMEPTDKAGLASVADYLESNVLRGKVAIRAVRPAYPEIIFKAGKGEFPLPVTSSMVSELAPVVLFLRYLVDPGEMLLIEEPESHLHPAVQRKFARAIARLVNSGVTVVLTTHSDYFLTEINNQIVAGSLPPKAQGKAGFAREECLDVSQVGAYLFKPVIGKGTTVRRMRVTKARGISQAEFARVNEELYAETVGLERRFHAE